MANSNTRLYPDKANISFLFVFCFVYCWCKKTLPTSCVHLASKPAGTRFCMTIAGGDMKKTSPKKAFSKRLVAAFATPLVVLGFSTAMIAGAAPAQAAGWTNPQVYWSSNSSNLHAWGQAYAYDYACGLKDCANGSNLKAQAGRLSGAYTSNYAAVSSTVAFDGVGISVGVSFPAGVSAGFTDAGSSCAHGWWYGSRYWSSVDFGSGTICDSDTWGYVGGMTTSAGGAVRFGSAWSIRSGASRIKLGGF